MLGDELDIYDDLDEFQEVEEKKSKELLALEEKYAAAQGEIEGLKAQNNKLSKQIKQMEVNLQNLLDTAKAEIKRKETLIAELRKEKDDICFRRKKPWGVEDSAREAGSRQKRPRHDKSETLESPGPLHKRAKQEEVGKNTTKMAHNAVQEKSLPDKIGSQQVDKADRHVSRSPSPSHSRKHRFIDVVQEKRLDKPVKIGSQQVDKTAKYKSRSPSPGHGRKPWPQQCSTEVVHSEKSMEIKVDKAAKNKSRSPSPGHSRKSSTHHRSTDSRTREREREKERDRERERGRRHERERRRSRSPKRSNQDEQHRNRVSQDKNNQSRRRSGSRSRQRTASSGTSREPSSNKSKSETLKSLFGDEINDGLVLQKEINIQGEPQSTEGKKGTKTKEELKQIDKSLDKPADLEASNEKKVHEDSSKQSDTGNTQLNLGTKPIPIPGPDLLPSETSDKKPHLNQQNKSKSGDNSTQGPSIFLTIKSPKLISSETMEMPHIPGLDLLTGENGTTEAKQMLKNEINTSSPGPSILSIMETQHPPTETIEMPQIPGLDLLTCETKETDTKLMEKKELKCKENSNADQKDPVKKSDTHKHSKDNRKRDKSPQVEKPQISTEPERMENAKTVADKSRKGKEKTHKEISNEPTKKEGKVCKEVAVDHMKRLAKDQKAKQIVIEPDIKKSLIIPEVNVLKEDIVDNKKRKEKEQISMETAVKPESKELLMTPEIKFLGDDDGDNKKQREKQQTLTKILNKPDKREPLITPEVTVLKDEQNPMDKEKTSKENANEAFLVTDQTGLTESIVDSQPTEKNDVLSGSCETIASGTNDSNKEENSHIIKPTASTDPVRTEQTTECIENKLHSSLTERKDLSEPHVQTILYAGLITPRRKKIEQNFETTEDDMPTPKRPTPAKKTKPITPPSNIIENDSEEQIPTKPLNRAIQIIEDIRLPVMMDIEHIAVRVDGVDENIDIPLPPASVKVLPTTKPSTVMYAQPDSTKIDHNENDMVLEAALNVLTAIEEGHLQHNKDQMGHQLGQNISLEFDTLESALEQLHQTSPDESIVTSTSTKAQQHTAKQDLIKILSRSPNHESPIKLQTKVERATEKTPLKKRKVNIMDGLVVSPKTPNCPVEPLEPIEPTTEQEQQHVTIDETLNVSDSVNSDSSIITKRCSLGQSDYQFERINDEVILRVTRRPRRRRPPANSVEIKQN